MKKIYPLSSRTHCRGRHRNKWLPYLIFSLTSNAHKRSAQVPTVALSSFMIWFPITDHLLCTHEFANLTAFPQSFCHIPQSGPFSLVQSSLFNV